MTWIAWCPDCPYDPLKQLVVPNHVDMSTFIPALHDIIMLCYQHSTYLYAMECRCCRRFFYAYDAFCLDQCMHCELKPRSAIEM